MDHFADRLIDATRAKGNALCVGLDPRWQSLPKEMQARHADGTLQGVARVYQSQLRGDGEPGMSPLMTHLRGAATTEQWQ